MVDTLQNIEFDIGIVGLGPRGLSVLERIMALAEEKQSPRISIAIFEPNSPGTGVHKDNQPDYLLLNTIACQLGVYPDLSALGYCENARPRTGPNFFEWCKTKGIRICAEGDVDQINGRPVKPSDFLPRRLLGDYLSEAFQNIIGDGSSHATVTLYAEAVNRLRFGPERSDQFQRGYTLIGDKGSRVTVDQLILTTGHIVEDKQVDHVHKARSRVLIQGLGLTAMDQLATLTRGKGGVYARDKHGRCSYTPSGNEPLVIMQSREGLMFRARPISPLDRERHKSLVLTNERLAHLRSSNDHGQLDFDTDILPLMRLEMRGAALAVRLARGNSSTASLVLQEMALLAAPISGGISALEAYLDTQELIYGTFDCDMMLEQTIPMGLDDKGYQDWIVSLLQTDLEAANAGLLLSPEKAAAEVWRDLRETLRTIVDFKGLTPKSHRRFYGHWVRLINRLVAGPQKERNEDLLALMEAGIVSLRHPKSQVSDCKIRLPFRVSSAGLCGVRAGIYANLRSMGVVRAVVATPGFDGIETTEDCRTVGRNGRVTPNLWALGPSTEGSTYYNHYVPAPGSPNRAMIDAHTVALACLAQATENSAPSSIFGATKHAKTNVRLQGIG